MTNNLVYGFLDESPSLNDQSFFFCVDIISTSEKTNKHLQNIIKRARKKIVKKQISKGNKGTSIRMRHLCFIVFIWRIN